ncbi:MAG: sigma-70 family RNA polymerase sigma factor [Bacteroidota bacterium]|nr:sigma-70 family RNA polymerase sigma factor [Bacteroidota bacterium]
MSEAITQSLACMPSDLSKASQLQWLRSTGLRCLYRNHAHSSRESLMPDGYDVAAPGDEAIDEAREIVEWALSKLPERTRKIMVSKIIDGYPLWEVAEVLGMKTKTVQTIFTRGMRCLKTIIKQEIERGGGGQIESRSSILASTALRSIAARCHRACIATASKPAQPARRG